jgi:hypothetical protein
MRIDLGGQLEPVKVLDVSTTGFAFESSTISHALPLGDPISACVQLGTRNVELKVLLVNRDENRVGCCILEPPAKWVARITQYIEPITLAAEMREVDSKYVPQEDASMTKRWFQSGRECDLFVWEEPDGTISHAQLNFMQHFVQWSKVRGLQTGTEVEETNPDQFRHDAANVFSIDL